MKQYKVKVTETLVKWFEVEAISEENAYEVAAEVFTHDNETGVEENYDLAIEVHGEGTWNPEKPLK